MYTEQVSAWKNREFLAGNIIFLTALAGLHLFPRQIDPLYNLMTYGTFFILFPIIGIKLVLRQPIWSFGFGWGKWKWGSAMMLCGWLWFGILITLIFRDTHPDFGLFAPTGIRVSFRLLLIYSAFTAVILAGFEVLFRGLFQTLWQRQYGRWAILVQAIVFCLWVVARGTPETIAEWVIITGIPLWTGWIFWQSQSLWITFLFSFGASILLNSAALLFL